VEIKQYLQQGNFLILKDCLRFDVNLSKTSWMKCGGTASALFKPRNVDDLIYFLKNFPYKDKIYILGACSNVIIPDIGIDGVVIKLGQGFNYVRHFKPNIIECGAATLDFNIAIEAAEYGIGNLEFLSSIPGTIGGNVPTNAGCYGSELKDVFVQCEAVDFNGDVHYLVNTDMGFAYRSSTLPKNLIITKITLQGELKNKKDIVNKMEEIKSQRQASQPITEYTTGSTFANPEGFSAWKLIDECGLRGYKIGGAMFSEKHCNFIVNFNNATSSDIYQLQQLAKQEVLAKFNINLNLEIIFI
jgi:UDP-N-acetylmuramate dehydrogenase